MAHVTNVAYSEALGDVGHGKLGGFITSLM
jgi:hypothetical protein